MSSMQAVVFHGPFDVRVEHRPVPVIQATTDAIVKVLTAGLCGSELHAYRGHQDIDSGYIMGHEFVGEVLEVGHDVKRHAVGQRVVCTFSVVCLNCFYCKQGHTNRCADGQAFGCPSLDGGTAEFVRVPHADGTMMAAPTSIPESLLIIMCDIFPTGFYAVKRAIQSLSARHSLDPEFEPNAVAESTVVCIGCGPVGLCAVICALSAGFKTVFAIDTIADRVADAARLGARPLQLGKDDLTNAVHAATSGRGADAIVELVGNSAALKLGFELVRPCGAISSVGFHQGDIPFTAKESYLKNPTINFGRVPVRAIFQEAFACLESNLSKLGGFVSHEMPLERAGEAFTMFERGLARKVTLTNR